MYTPRWWAQLLRGMAVMAMLSVLLGLTRPSPAADFTCTAGEVACLIQAITTANGNGEANTITLEAGTYTLTQVNNTTDRPNGLPSITSTLTVQGAGADTTIVERDASAPELRLIQVAATGTLTLEGLTLRGGVVERSGGGGVRNEAGGTVTLTNSVVADNLAASGNGSGFANMGTLILTHSTVRGNGRGAGGGASGGDL